MKKTTNNSRTQTEYTQKPTKSAKSNQKLIKAQIKTKQNKSY